MSKDLAVLVPVLGRPQRVRPTVEAFNATVPGARLLFIATLGDRKELAELESVGVDTLVLIGGYSQKINAAVKATDEPFVLLGADDLEPQPGWFEKARAHMRDGVQVVGLNDTIVRRRDRHATHFLLTREYAERPTIDGEPGPLSTTYHHWNLDDELIATAEHRGVYVYAEDAVIVHRHPMNETMPDDGTYQLGRSRWRQDRRMFNRRARLWS